eukprot:SAG31_NODE_1280_length_9033_cov_11.049810_4_plen_84_part_00
MNESPARARPTTKLSNAGTCTKFSSGVPVLNLVGLIIRLLAGYRDGEQEQDHSLEIELDVVVNWLENLDLGEKCELRSGFEAE